MRPHAAILARVFVARWKAIRARGGASTGATAALLAALEVGTITAY